MYLMIINNFFSVNFCDYLCIDPLAHLYAPVGDRDGSVPVVDGDQDVVPSTEIVVSVPDRNQAQAALLPGVPLNRRGLDKDGAGEQDEVQRAGEQDGVQRRKTGRSTEQENRTEYRAGEQGRVQSRRTG